MRRHLAKISSLVLVLAFLLSTMAAFAADLPVEAKRAMLEANGLPHDFAENLSEEWVDYIYQYSEGDALYLGEQVHEYLYQNNVSVFGTISDSDMTLTISPVYVQGSVQNGRHPINRLIIMIEYEWAKGHPLITHEDGISVNWAESVFCFEPDSFKSVDYQRWQGSSVWQAKHENVDPAKLNQGGLGYFANLTGYGQTADNPPDFKGTASFVLSPTSPIYDEGGPLNTTISVEYVHDKTPFLGSISFTYNGFGISISPPALSDSVGKGCRIKYAK